VEGADDQLRACFVAWQRGESADSTLRFIAQAAPPPAPHAPLRAACAALAARRGRARRLSRAYAGALRRCALGGQVDVTHLRPTKLIMLLEAAVSEEAAEAGLQTAVAALMPSRLKRTLGAISAKALAAERRARRAPGDAAGAAAPERAPPESCGRARDPEGDEGARGPLARQGARDRPLRRPQRGGRAAARGAAAPREGRAKRLAEAPMAPMAPMAGLPMAPMAGLPMAPMAGLPMARVTPTAMSPQMRPWSGADDGSLDAPAEGEGPGGLAVFARAAAKRSVAAAQGAPAGRAEEGRASSGREGQVAAEGAEGAEDSIVFRQVIFWRKNPMGVTGVQDILVL